METGRLADATRHLRHVFLRNMVLQARIGVHGHEHGRTQRVRINVDLAVDDDGALPASRAPASRADPGRDELPRVVDYERLAAEMRRIVALRHVALVETLAERLAEACLTDDRVVLARIRVEKLDVFDDMEAAGVEVERRRG